MALEKLGTGKHQKRVLLLISDGSDNRSEVSHQEFSNLNADTLVYAIATQDAYMSKSLDIDFFGSMGTLEALSSDTGGVAYLPRDNKDLVAILENLATELRQQYRMTFKPPVSNDQNKWQELKVKLSPSSTLPRELRQNLILRSRKGYYSL